MKNILVPVDFSENSKNALDYAQDLALYLDASIEVVHITHPTINANYPPSTYNFDEQLEHKTKVLEEFVHQQMDQEVISVITKRRLKNKVVIGYAAEEIVKLAEKDNIDLIVMGATGEGGVLDKLLGSISTIVAQNAKCPVLLIPQSIVFKDLDNIMYASDYNSSSNELLETIVNFSSKFEAKIHLAHVQQVQGSQEFELEELIINQIAETNSPDTFIKFVSILDNNIWHGLNIYARDHSIDLMVLVRPQRNFWDRIFHRSVTKQMIQDTTKPLLILPTQA